MRTHILSFFAGILLLTVFPALPPVSWLWSIAATAVLLLFVLLIVRHLALPRQIGRVSGVLLAVGLGFLFSAWQAHLHQSHIVTAEWEGQDMVVTGVVDSLPEWREGQWQRSLRFVLDIEQAEAPHFSGKVRLSWYQGQPDTLVAGERWQLVIRAKRPNGFMNPGGFDYEQWLFAQRYVATGYVRRSAHNQRVDDTTQWHSNRWRQVIRDGLDTALPERAETGLLQGLSIGYRTAITQDQWDVLRKTGTTHLLAISGLHIGLVAGFGFLLVLPFWWLLPRLYLYVPIQVAGAVVGAGLAIGYALLAGMTIPTQRALVMVLVLMVGLLVRRRIPISLTLSVALLLVLLIDPFAPLSAGFWLSFSAVSLLALLRYRRQQAGWGTLVWMQLALSVGMLPLTAAFFGEVSLVSPLANLLAIPWVSFLVVPWVLLGVLCLPVFPDVAQGLWWVAAESLHYLMQVLAYLADGEWAAWSVPDVPWFVLLLSGLGVVLLLLPRGVPGRWLGVVAFLPLFLYLPDVPEAGDFRLTVLDVGQGSARVVQTRNHVLVFDAGPKSSPTFDTGKLVMLPFLRAQGIRQVDALLVSHADKDHSGGVQALLAGMDVKQVYVNDAALQEQHQGVACVAGQSWRWDGVDFAVVHPAVGFDHGKRNNRSCVLRVSNGEHSVLLAADIERAAEKWLARNTPAAIAADVLLVPHHGSLTSSSPSFLNAVDPQWAVVSSGYRNRFRHPHPKVVARYRARGIALFNTAETGALRLDFRSGESAPDIQSWREQNRSFWHR